ncbi:MAG TPA: hypothetical protein VEW93_02480 [Acidimicrobiales bacterium]|nr:hypothetical protein [Acidimicrobiales bacterium]
MGPKAPDTISAEDIERILDELGGLEQILHDAEPHEKTQVYASLGLGLRYQPDENRAVATADLGRVLSRVGGPSGPLPPRAIPRSEALSL